jgi:excinuclease ABC subunit B
VKKAIADILQRHTVEEQATVGTSIEVLKKSYNALIPAQRKQLLKALEAEMPEHARKLEFEQAAVIRYEIERIKSIGKSK